MSDEAQEKIHKALESVLPLEGPLVSWIVVFEEVTDEGKAQAGHCYGPDGLTTWRALGLLEWVRTRTLVE